MFPDGVSTMTPASTVPLTDEHSVLLWQTCAHADDLADAARSGQPLARARDSMLEFLHYRLLPYLSDEERCLPPARLRDEHMFGLLLADHERLRDDVDNIESSRTRGVLTLASSALVDRLDRHVRREEIWVSPGDGVDCGDASLPSWALPLLLADEIDLDALRTEHRDRLVLQRLARMRHGETVRLEASRDHQGCPETPRR